MPTISRKKKILIVTLGLAAFAAIAHSAYRSLSVQKLSEDGQLAKELSLGMTLPLDVLLQPLSGSAKAVSDYAGKVVVINFWAGWCAPCIAEMPGLYALRERLQSKGFEVLALNMDADPKDGMRVLRQKVGEAPFPIFKGVDSSMAGLFPIGGLPYTVVIDRNQKIHYAKAGEVNWERSDAVSMIEGML